jgi:spore maturation protein CgeB
LRKAITDYDLVLTYGGGDPVVTAYREAGARFCAPIYNALDPDTHHPVPPRPEFACDLSFLGNRLPDREARVTEFFLDPASLLPQRSFLLAGAGWETKTLPANVRHLGHVGTADHNAFFCSGLATINVNRDSMARFGYSPPTRIFEAAGASACLICDPWEGVELFLEPGEHILLASDADAVAEQLAQLTPERARRIGEAARQRILAEHTYAHRARTVSALLDMHTKREAAA